MSSFSDLALSRVEMKNVTGGCSFSCAGDGWGRTNGLSRDEAKKRADGCIGGRGYWCCASC